MQELTRCASRAKRSARWLLPATVAFAVAGFVVPAGQAGAVAQSGPATWNVSVGASSADSSVQGMGFYPNVITIDEGDTIVFTQAASEPHTVTFLNGTQPPQPGSPASTTPENVTTVSSSGQVTGYSASLPAPGTAISSGLLIPGQTMSVTFPTGTIPAGQTSATLLYICDIHAGMQGVVIVNPAGTPYPETQAGYTSDGQAQASADLVAGQGAASAFQATTSPGPNGTTVWHAAAGVSPPETDTVSLSSENAGTVGYTASGSATLAITGPTSLQVSLTVSGLPAGSTHPAHIHNGTCTSDGGVAFALPNLVADASGNATETTTVTVPLGTGIPEAGWFVNVHNGPDMTTSSGATPVACGNVVYHDASVMRFLPASLNVHVGDQVVWTQLAPQEIHTVSFLAPGQSPPPFPSPQAAAPAGGSQENGTSYVNSGVMAPFQSYALTFTQPGTFSYRCLLHDDMGMIASVSVAPGYRLAGGDGGVFSFGLPYYGSLGGTHLNAPVVGTVNTPDNLGYWLVAKDGGVFAFGDAGFYGSLGGTALNQPIVGMTSTPDGKGYWLVGAHGATINFGDAGFFGSAGSMHLNAPVVDISPTPDGMGYWLVGADGGVFSFGDAPFLGSMGGKHLNAPVVDMTSPMAPMAPKAM